MGLSHLRTFHYCATYLSFSKTAQHFELSQPAITKQIKKLESDLGQALFIRAGRKLFLTAAGEALFEYSSQIFRLYEDALDTMRDLSEKKRKLRIVGDLNYMKMNLSEFFAKAYERFPDIEIEIDTAENAKLIFSGVRDKQYDIGILSANYTTIGVRDRLLREDNIYLVSSTALASRMRREPDLQPPLLFYKSESSYSSFLQEFMHRNGLSDAKPDDLQQSRDDPPSLAERRGYRHPVRRRHQRRYPGRARHHPVDACRIVKDKDESDLPDGQPDAA